MGKSVKFGGRSDILMKIEWITVILNINMFIFDWYWMRLIHIVINGQHMLFSVTFDQTITFLLTICHFFGYKKDCFYKGDDCAPRNLVVSVHHHKVLAPSSLLNQKESMCSNGMHCKVPMVKSFWFSSTLLIWYPACNFKKFCSFRTQFSFHTPHSVFSLIWFFYKDCF